MEITVSSAQLWHYPLGTPFETCQSRLALPATPSLPAGPPADRSYDGMYVEVFGIRWLATITFKDGLIHRQTLLAAAAGRKQFTGLHQAIKSLYGRAYRRGFLRATGYIWDFPSSQLILTVKTAGPLTGIYLILTAKP